MRFRDGFALSEALEACGPFLKSPYSGTLALSSRFESIDDPERCGSHSLILMDSHVRLETRNELQAMLVLAEKGINGLSESILVVQVTNARLALAALIEVLASRIEYEAPFTSGGNNVIGPNAVVEGTLEGDIVVGAGAYVGPGTFIGRGTRIEPRAVIQEHCIIGRDCVVQSGAVIGCAGFGFVEVDGKLKAMPHLAGVRIGNHCFVGANTVIAAGVLHPTEIGDGCKLDSHVQIAHNVRLGRNCLFASQSGIAGSTQVGDGLRMGGAASISGHLRIGNNVSVAAKSGVTKDLADGAVVAGFPAMPIDEWRKQQILLRNRETV